MKVPVSSPQIILNAHSPNPKDNSTTTTSNNNNNNVNGLTIGFQSNIPSLCYEPTSVLDLPRSQSPVARRPANATEPLDQWDEHVFQTLDWDSIMRELDDFHEDSVPALKSFPQYLNSSVVPQHLPDLSAPPPPHIDPALLLHSDFKDFYFNSISNHNLMDSSHHHPHHHNFLHATIGSNAGGSDFIQELIRAAECFDSSDLQLAHVILERLNHRLHSPAGKPLQRAAFFFKEALLSLLLSLTASTPSLPLTLPSSWSEIVQTIRAYKAFSAISPIPMFTHFTTNQALLESLHGSPPFIHVVDFDIGFASHYASFMKEFAEKFDSCKLPSPVLRITAVVTEEFAVETKLIKESLSQFAQELNIRIQIDFVLFRTFEMLSFKAINFMNGGKTAVLLSPTIFRRLVSTTNITAFANDLRRISPNVVVFVDSEGWVASGTASFRRNFVNGLEFYSMIFESLDAAGVAGGGDWLRKIEMLLMKPRIVAAVDGCGTRVGTAWREVFYGAGMKAVQTSQFADFQAECLLGKLQMKGFYVAKRQAELVLCWHERPLVAISAWKC